ncbi:tRNA (mnm(5)s(2)U34)-methyltransferase [Salirhabdus sp. Marseille-P4669]|uniref:tRNA (mnm(5)s(2)U34)-methyltransferase n=1 Tax=Salirhabdus sp. Marseille-P4669 TaxID=2042310 RepID=UPI000C7D11D6|nr:class I SAM-dependent methyltransferase [Salirhabdus sp. Marseille-P4669]
MLQRVLTFSHTLLKQSVEIGDYVIDATAGNGHDTVMLAKLVGEAGHVLSFDVQKQAIVKTTELLNKESIHHVTVIQDSHQNLENYFTEEMKGNIGGAIFNLGYLPGGNHTITTKPDSTIQAIESILPHLKPGKLLVLVVYYGHEGGKVEKDQILAFLHQLNQQQYNVLQYQFINQKNDPPFLLAIEKRR